MAMKKPLMILFDYGHTLTYEDKWDAVNGEKAVLKYASSNINDLTAEQVATYAESLYNEFSQARKESKMEIHQHQFQRLTYEYLQIKIDLPPHEIEEIYWDNASPAHAMPHIGETLAFLRGNNIRTGVVSNNSFSSVALKKRLDRILPENCFEFFISTSDYIIRKPNKMIFELALRKARLSAGDVWYCGDSVDYDVAGAAAAGIYPVWYESDIDCWYVERGSQAAPECEHLHITDWLELIEALK